ncbi:MAG: hypothetical protein BWY21_00946 [Parcubacteria group bacterium ADurb.Bin216]|nr:MAG: hypothetical protein BWY21_00946 [Parcubacteria group bacterium ADurb.Bin216]
MKLEVGQTVFLKSTKPWLKDDTDEITKIGRKYLETKNHGKYRINDLNDRNGSGESFDIYDSEKSYHDNMKRYEMFDTMYHVFGRSYPKHLSLDQLRRIDAIINENNESKE